MKTAVVEHEALDLALLLEKVYRDGGYDFRYYKRGTVTRRLARRLHAVGASTYREYMQFLDTSPEEYREMAEELTIKVSGFFRSPYCFGQVMALVLPELLGDKAVGGERELCFWSAGCARGEEPYSIAMLLDTVVGRQKQDLTISIKASDISQKALKEAQAAVYAFKDLEALPEALLQNYFIPHQQGYQVRDDIRNMVSFSRFDLTSADGPPFTGIDCIFCCNVLIYLQRQLQERLLNMLYDSLADHGYLILGEVETPTGNYLNKFKCLDGKAKIYKKVIE